MLQSLDLVPPLTDFTYKYHPAHYGNGKVLVDETREGANRVENIVVARQLVVATHVAQVLSVDEAKTTDIHSEEHAVLATAARDRLLL